MEWTSAKKILVVRLDGIGDVITSSPAIRALKETFNYHITLLCSASGAMVAKLIDQIDDVICYDAPWFPAPKSASSLGLISMLKSQNFDGAIIFTVFSQNPLASALIINLAEIPLCLAYCRENPYELISNWVPDPEPLSWVSHQVRRDLNLVATIGATTKNENFQLNAGAACLPAAVEALTEKPLIVLHPGVSELKRTYPAQFWQEIASRLSFHKASLVVTGSSSETELTKAVASGGNDLLDLGGKLDFYDFTKIIAKASLLITVNTSASHVACAFGVPQLVLYAQTNPQHVPWMSPAHVFYFSIDEKLKSKNQLLRHIDRTVYSASLQKPLPYPNPAEVAELAERILTGQVVLEPLTEYHFSG